MHHARARDNRLGRAAIVFAPALAVAALAGHPSGSHPSVVKGAGHRVTLQVTLSGTIKGRLSNLHAGHGFSCARAAVGSPFVLGEVHGTVGGVRYRFSVGTDVYQAGPTTGCQRRSGPPGPRPETGLFRGRFGDHRCSADDQSYRRPLQYRPDGPQHRFSGDRARRGPVSVLKAHRTRAASG